MFFYLFLFDNLYKFIHMILTINNCIAKIIPYLPKSIIKQFAKKYVAGTTIDEAISAVKKLDNMGQYTTLDILGEHTPNVEECKNITNQYIKILEAININNLKCNLSIKPSHIGSDINNKTMVQNFKQIQNKAIELNNFIRLDMENSNLTQLTIDTYNTLTKTENNIGIVFQAYLHRTIDDIKKLKNVNIRLCKGIYNESDTISIKDPKDINKNFLYLLEQAFSNNMYVGIATHDQVLIKSSIELINKLNINNNQFEFQYLYGVPMGKMISIYKKNNFKIRAYIPFGLNWYEYSLRRIKENPKIISYVIKNMLK